MRLTIQSKLFLSHFTAIILVSGSVGTYFYQSATENLMRALQSRLRNSAALISQGLDTQNLDQIRVETDRASPAYKKHVLAMREFVKANPDIAFIYVMRKVGDRVFFVLDTDTQDPAMPGEEYSYEIASLMDGFMRPSVDEKITQDRWGYFLSGYSPLDGGEDDYLVGIDMRADEVQSKFEKIRLTGVLSLSLSVILAMIFSRLLSLHLTKRITNLATRFATIAPIEQDINHEIRGDELDQLSLSFDQMASRLKIKQQQIDANQIALHKAHNEMERRIEMRTAELVQTNEKLLQEIAERKHVEHMLEETSRIDYLTGILNRRAMTTRLEQVVSQTGRGANSFCTILLDIDHFKMVNDNYGHDVADQVLRHCVEQLRKYIRESDELGRWGGEEFLVLSLDTELAQAVKLAQRLCDELSVTSVVQQNHEISVTASFGVTQYQSGEALAYCLKRADDALYAAKANGRNCVVVAEQG
ncbi:MAG: diguanylate cyclase [Candidatus Thiodiazotropha sp. (ex Lucinoma kastoroae)]|nr:diguanylate cyclase [Candidatus Thiodiazotropha sp. (ex Lucinoma kastoroae)]